MQRRRFFIRNIEAAGHLEAFLISAVASILLIRGFLELSGYPQMGGSDLHIAHVLWGGLLMLASIFIMLMFLSKAAERFSAIIGGIGFGTFIDEVGKFVTDDNDYFFRPSVAIIYVVFMLIFLFIRSVQQRQSYSQVEYLMNSIRELEEVALHDLDPHEKRIIINYLKKSDPSNPLVSQLRQAVEGTDLVPEQRPRFFRRIRNFMRVRYKEIACANWFHWVIIGFFLVEMMASFSYAAMLIVSEQIRSLGFVDWAQLSSSLLSASLVLWGILLIRKSNIHAFGMFEYSMLVSIFFTQVFQFYEDQLWALSELVAYLLILLGLRFMIEQEQRSPDDNEQIQQVTSDSTC